MIISLLSSFVVFWIEHNQSKHHRKFSNKRYFLVRNIFLLNSWILVDAYLTNYIMTFPYHYIAGITLKKKNNFLLNETTLKHLENYLKHEALSVCMFRSWSRNGCLYTTKVVLCFLLYWQAERTAIYAFSHFNKKHDTYSPIVFLYLRFQTHS